MLYHSSVPSSTMLLSSPDLLLSHPSKEHPYSRHTGMASWHPPISRIGGYIVRTGLTAVAGLRMHAVLILSGAVSRPNQSRVGAHRCSMSVLEELDFVISRTCGCFTLTMSSTVLFQKQMSLVCPSVATHESEQSRNGNLLEIYRLSRCG